MALTTYEKYEQYWQILKNNQEMIRFSEVKAGLVISVYGILFSVMLNETAWLRAEIARWPWYLFVVVSVFLAIILVSLYYSFKCFRPRFENKNPTSIIYFGDIVSDFQEYMAYHAYLEKTVVNDYEMSVQLAEQIHTNSTIATRKFQAVSKSVKLMLISIYFLILVVGMVLLV